MSRRALVQAAGALLAGALWGRAGAAAAAAPLSATPASSPEARLIELYRLIGAGDLRRALSKAESLTRDVPTFQLAQLVYGDLLLVRQGRLSEMQAPSAELPASAAAHWMQLRQEARLRLAALVERPPANTAPRQFIDLPTSTRHAIAVDASRARLYLFENRPQGLHLVGDHYVSLGRLGIDKKEEGDQRTPLGVYFIGARLDARQLRDFYGPGALTLNYPNEYDRRRGRKGGGIWLHGVPSDNYARTPQSTDGCVVLANDDMRRLLREVAPRRTPVVIAPRLEWTPRPQAERDRAAMRALIEQWRSARMQADGNGLTAFYSPQFSSGGHGPAAWIEALQRDAQRAGGREIELKELSILAWRDTSDVLIVSFGEVRKGHRSGPMKRQYWSKDGGQWRIFYEGVIG